MARGSWTPSDPPTGYEPIPPAKVTEGTVTVDETDAKYIRLGEQLINSTWIDYKVNNRFEEDRHIYMMGATSPNGDVGTGFAASFVQLARTTLLWIADWTAARLNIQPIIPDPNRVDSRWLLMDKHIEPAIVTLGPDGVTPLYRISGTYVYGCLSPNPDLVNDIAFGRAPWMKDDTPQGRGFPESFQAPSIID